MKKKIPYQFKNIIVKEYFEERKKGIYLIWEFEDGQKIERLTPYDKLPYVIVKGKDFE